MVGGGQRSGLVRGQQFGGSGGASPGRPARHLRLLLPAGLLHAAHAGAGPALHPCPQVSLVHSFLPLDMISVCGSLCMPDFACSQGLHTFIRAGFIEPHVLT